MGYLPGLTIWEFAGCAVTGVLAAILCLRSMPPALAVLGGYLLFAVLAISLIDYRQFIIPDILSVSAIPLGLLASLLSSRRDFYLDPFTDALIGALVGGCSFYLVRALYLYLRGFEGLGLGDVKLAAAAGAWVGLTALPLVILVATAAALSAVAVSYFVGEKRAITRTTPIPFGSFLAPPIWMIWFYVQVTTP